MDPRFPALPEAMEPDHEHVVVSADGSMRDHFNMVYSAENAERIRTGYCCINCGESQVDHGAPFPSNCWVCGYEMKDKQTERYGMEFRGNVRLGPSTSIDEELAIAEEMVERQKLAKLGMRKTNSIIVPGWSDA